MTTDGLIESVQRAVQAVPDDVGLRVHLAQLLLAAGRTDEAIRECGVAVQQDPGHAGARALLIEAVTPPASGAAPTSDETATDAPVSGRPVAGGPGPGESSPPREAPAFEPESSAGSDAASPEQPTSPAGPVDAGGVFDWDAAEAGFTDAPGRMFVDGDPDDVPVDVWEVENPGLTLADVGGLTEVKERLEVGFLAPMRNPEMRALYGKSLKGGLLLYGPPGCGKTFVARAVAGEMGASFMSVGISDVLDMYIGNSEQNLHRLFEEARANAPVVLFLDEVDALGAKRTSQQSWMRTVVNQLLTELDGQGSSNEGVFVLGATNQPWDVDPALRRPGRFDRLLLVSPPDRQAREAIFRHHLKTRPIEGIDLGRLAAKTEGLTGADIAFVCEAATEAAMMDGIRSGQVRLIGMGDLEAAISRTRPSTGDWFVTARNVLQFADPHGTYSELRDYMKRRKLW